MYKSMGRCYKPEFFIQHCFYFWCGGYLLLGQNFLDCLKNLAMNGRWSSNNTFVLGQSSSFAEIQPSSQSIGDLSTSLADNEITSSMVPNLLLICSTNWQSQVDITSSSSNGTVLGLRIHSDTWLRDTKLGSNGELIPMRRVTCLHTLAECCLCEVLDWLHLNRLALW